MFEWRLCGVSCSVGVPFFVLLATALTVDKSGTAALCVLASFLHEGGHIAALLLLARPPRALSIGLCGIRLVASEQPLSYRHQAAMLLAGPVTNLLCAAALYPTGNLTAVVAHLLLGCFNLLPIEGLDGGECLRCLLYTRWGGDTAARSVRVLSVTVLLPLSAAGFYLLLQHKNLTLFAVCGYLIARLFANERI